MRLLNILWQKRNNLLIIILTLFAILPAVPIITSGTNGIFYNMDPEMALVGNSLSYIRDHLIHYRDHPGTPTIIYITSTYIPLRIYTKFIEHTNFIVWSFDNLRFLFLYTRLSMIGLFLISVFIYLTSIKKLTNNYFAIIFSWLALFSFSFTPRLAGAVLTETLSFFFISLWFSLFTMHYKKLDSILLYLMSFIAGLAVANKYNNFPILFISILLSFLLIKITNRQKIYSLFINSIFAIGGFIVGTWPIRNSYLLMIKQITKVISQSGEGASHGVSNSTIFDISSFLINIKNFYVIEPLSIYIFLITVAFLLWIIFFKKINKNKVEKSIIIMFSITLLSVVFIFKYSLSYYQFPNFVLIFFTASYFISKIPKLFILVTCVLMISYSVNNINIYRNYLVKARESSVFLENYLQKNPAKYASLWDYGPSEDFMKIWIRGWGGGIYNRELKNKRPDILELKSDYATVFLDDSNYSNVFEACWDKLYIREYRAKVFLDLYKTKKLNYLLIGNTGIWEITSNHCTTKL